MRRAVASAVVVAAVAAVAVAAVVDAVRPEPELPLDAEAAAQLAELGVTGTLIYTDAGCELHALSLPELVGARVPEGDAGCEISVSPDGNLVGPASVRWSASGEQCAGVCAWRGDEPTRAEDGEIRAGETVLVPRSELARAAPSQPIDVLDLAWASADELAALIDSGGARSVATFRDGRLVASRPHFGDFDRFVVAGGEAHALPGPEQFSQQFRITPRGPADYSPDGRRLAAATRASVHILDFESGRSVRLPLTVRDLAWR